MITPLVIISAITVFSLSFAAHVYIWKVFRPARQAVLLAALFFAMPALVFFALFFWARQGAVERFAASASNLLYALILDYVLAGGYLLSYPAAQASSPSLRVVLALSSTPDGMTGDQLRALFSEKELFWDHLARLEQEGLVVNTGGRWTASPRGLRAAGFFARYRSLLGLPEGNG